MVKKAKKKTAKNTRTTAKTRKTVKKNKPVAGAKTARETTAKMHSMAFRQLVAHAHKFKKSPLCYREYPDGSAQVCKLMPDGTYGDCENYSLRPVPDPRCG